MERKLMVPSFLAASIILLALLTSGVGPLWLLLPALVFATILATTMLAGSTLRRIGLAALRILLAVPALLLMAVALYALAIHPTRPLVLWVVLGFALVVLSVSSKLWRHRKTPKVV